MDHLVELIGVTKVYDRASRPALEDVSLHIPAGQVTAIMGPSGSGKSTLLNLVGGLDRTTQGTIRVAGTEITGLREAALARYRRASVGLIFQYFNLLNNLNVRDNILIPAQLAGLDRKTALQRATELMTQLGIVAEAGALPARLSGGQRQRVAIARALINRPALLLADEPTGALDTRTGEGVLDLFQDLRRTGQTILLVTHDPRLAERYADRVITLIDGTLAHDTAALEAVR